MEFPKCGDEKSGQILKHCIIFRKKITEAETTEESRGRGGNPDVREAESSNGL